MPACLPDIWCPYLSLQAEQAALLGQIFTTLHTPLIFWDMYWFLLTYEMSEQVWEGQVGEVDVGGRLHVLVPEDDETRGDVAEHAEDEDDGVHHRDGHDGGERQVARTEGPLDVGREGRGVATWGRRVVGLGWNRWDRKVEADPWFIIKGTKNRSKQWQPSCSGGVVWPFDWQLPLCFEPPYGFFAYQIREKTARSSALLIIILSFEDDGIPCIILIRLLPERVGSPIINGVDDRRRIVHSWTSDVFLWELGRWHERGSGNSGSREQTSFINRVSVALWVHCHGTLEPSHVCFIFHLHIHFIFVYRKNIRYICADAASFETINLAVDEDEMDMEMEYGTMCSQ